MLWRRQHYFQIFHFNTSWVFVIHRILQSAVPTTQKQMTWCVHLLRGCRDTCICAVLYECSLHNLMQEQCKTVSKKFSFYVFKNRVLYVTHSTKKHAFALWCKLLECTQHSYSCLFPVCDLHFRHTIVWFFSISQTKIVPTKPQQICCASLSSMQQCFVSEWICIFE